MSKTFRDYGDSSDGIDRVKLMERYVKNINNRCDGVRAFIKDNKIIVEND